MQQRVSSATGLRLFAEVDPGHRELTLLGDGPPQAVAHAAEVLGTLTPLFKPTPGGEALRCPLSWAAVVQLSTTYGLGFVPGGRLCAWIEAQTAARAASPGPDGRAPLAYAPPAGLVPYSWQAEGAQLTRDVGSWLCTDEPGTGKTAATILGLMERAVAPKPGHRPPWPALVVCPASVVDSWVSAWGAWAPGVHVAAWRGGKARRRDLIHSGAQVFVASYDTVRADAGVWPNEWTARGAPPLLSLAGRHGLGAIVIDECHLIKSDRAQRSRAVRRLAHRCVTEGGVVLPLSGTPITHHPGDLWPTLDAMDHDAWPSSERWLARYCLTVDQDYGRPRNLGIRPDMDPEFRLALLGQHRRVAKADVLTQLPPKVYSVRHVELPAQWRKAYDEFQAQMLAELPRSEDGGSDELSVFDALSMLSHLRSLSASAADVRVEHGPDVDEDTGEPKRHVHLDLKAPSWKVDALLELLEERAQVGGRREQVVAFGASAQLMALAGVAAERAGHRVGYVVGGQTPRQRTAAVDAFQAGALDLICATTGAGGVGITLTAARTVVFLQRPWSLVESLQAEDRCHRIGSEVHDSIEVVDIIARDTLDDRVRDVLRNRAEQLSELVQDRRVVETLLGGLA